MPGSEIESSDARQQPRIEALRGAMILLANGKPPLHCLITNLSPEGAELRPVSDARVPPYFMLHVPNDGVAYRAEVRWREEGRIGVVFNGSEKRDRPALSVAAERPIA